MGKAEAWLGAVAGMLIFVLFDWLLVSLSWDKLAVLYLLYLVCRDVSKEDKP